MWVQSLGQKDPLEEGMATHSSFFCPENPLDRGAWQATVDRVAKSWTQLKRLSMHARLNHWTTGKSQWWMDFKLYIFKSPLWYWGFLTQGQGKSGDPECHQESTAIVQAREDDGLDKDGGSGMERREELEVERGGGLNRACGWIRS